MSTEVALEPRRASERKAVDAVVLAAVDRLVVAGTDALLGALAAVDRVVVSTPGGRHQVRCDVWRHEGVAVAVLGDDGVILTGADGVSFGSSALTLPTPDADISALLRTGLAALPPTTRADLLGFLLATCAAGREVLPAGLAGHLHLARQALRPRLAPGVVVRDARAVKVEVIAEVDATTFYLRGWIAFPSSALRSVVAVSPEGARCEMLPSLYRHRRDDVARFYGEDDDAVDYGFAGLVEIAVPSRSTQGWVVEVVPHGADAFEAAGADTVRDPDAVRNLVIGDLAIEAEPGERFRTDHVEPAVSLLLRRAAAAVEIRQVVQFGAPPPRPDVTIIVPLYRRIDFVDHQLAQFVDDPEIAQADLLYVLDSPELGDAFVAEAHRWFRFYEVPFRIALLSRNGGFSRANNLGATLARGRLLLLMNSDVLPDRPGWLGELVRCHDARPGVGAVGPKLVYEDESIQHAGMYFDRPVGSTTWGNEHYFKGLHRSFPAANVARRVPAVTAACMLVSTDQYRHFGGLSGSYVQGDFEDSDLCLRMAADGLHHWYAAHVELYHLEGQSYPTAARVANGRYNRWLHSHVWGSTLDEVMAADVDRSVADA